MQFREHMKKTLLLGLIPIMLAGCTGSKVNIGSNDAKLVSENVTEAQNVVIYPDDNPSVADGKGVWQKMNCAQCHSDTGKPVSGKAQVNLADAEYMAKQKPLDQYVFLTYGKPGVNHPQLKNALSRRELWDLVFYSRSLAIAPLTDEEVAQVLPVWGSNCAVCHGTRGHGDGPLAKNLDPTPANFHQFDRFYDRDDNILEDHIANGIPWEGMPNFLNKQDRTKNVKFDRAYIKKLVQFVRHFHEDIHPTVAQTPDTTKPDTKAE
jgi:mono/diheme cytochrome c family protein